VSGVGGGFCHQFGVGGRRYDRGGEDHQGCDEESGGGGAAQRREEDGAGEVTQDGEGGAHALADQDRGDEAEDQNGFAGEAGELVPAGDQGDGGGRGGDKQQMAEQGAGAGFPERAGERAVRPTRVAENVGAGEELLPALDADPEAGTGEQAPGGAAGWERGQQPGLQSKSEDQETQNDEGVGEGGEPAGAAREGGGAGQEPGPPEQGGDEPGLAEGFQVSCTDGVQDEQGVSDADADFREDEGVQET